MNNQNSIEDAETKFLPGVKQVRIVPGSEGRNRAALNGGPIRLDARELMARADYCRAAQFAWHLIAAPDGSRARIAYSTLVRARFFPDLSGVYLIKLEASTGAGTLEYVTRVVMSDSGEESSRGARPSYQLTPATVSMDRASLESEEGEAQTTMRGSDLRAGALRPIFQSLRLFFLRMRRALGVHAERGPAYGEPVSTF